MSIETNPIAPVLTEGELLRDFQDRSRILLNHIAGLPRPESDIYRKLMFYSMARLGLGVQTEVALADLAFVNNDPGSGDMFFRHANIDAYLRFGHLYPQSLRNVVRERMLDRYEVHHGHTENHRILIAVAGYLVAQTWPQWSEAATTQAAMGAYLDTFFDRVCRFGQGEFDSTTYSVLYLISLATLCDFAHDDLMRQKARMMLDWFLANAAGEWLNGYFIGGHSRDVHPTEGPEFATAGNTAMWLYFGGRRPDFNTGEPHYAILSALTSYRMPSLLARIALDRSQPYEHRETHDLLKIDGETHDLVKTKQVDACCKGYGYVSQVGVRKYAWRTANYALSSLYDGRQGDVNFWAAVRRWALDWDSPRPASTLFFTHPFPDPQNTSDHYYRTWQGSSPFEQVVQHRNALIAVYNVPTEGTYYHPFSKKELPANRNPFIEGFFSGAAILHLEEDPSGWIFAHGGSVLMAMRPLRPYRWIDRPTVDAQALPKAVVHGRLQSEGAKNAVVVEAAESREFSQEGEAALPHPQRLASELSRFRESILATTRIEAALDAPMPSVAYVARTGELLRIEYDGDRSINGQVIDYNAWPLIDDPFMHSAVNSGKLELQYGRDVRTLDFVRWSCGTGIRPVQVLKY